MIDRFAPEGSNERFRLAFEHANVAIGIADLQGNVLEANEPLATLFGYSTTRIKSLNIKDLWAPEDRVLAQADLDDAARKEKLEREIERPLVRKDGETFLAAISRGLVSNLAGDPMYFTFTVRDITQARRIQAMLEEQASTDTLTGAMNRARIDERARLELMRSDRYGNKLSLIMIDLDHFKHVNDAYGHAAGDIVLKGFCDIARGLLRSIDILGRWGGEEFVALLPETDIGGAQIVAERLRTVLEGFSFENRIRVTASMGVASHREDEEFSSILSRADACLYQAKLEGRNRVVVDPEDLALEASAKPAVPVLLRLQWKPSYQCGVPSIDAEHLELFEMANRIIACVTGNTGGNGSLGMFRELIDHLGAHFTHEEQSLLAAEYPDAAEHLQIHRSLNEQACKLADKLARGEGSEVYLLRFLVHEIVAKHMLVDDRKFFDWFETHQN